VPAISRFLGIVIAMYYNDHAPPHFHARYGEHEALYQIDDLVIYAGELPKRSNAMVLEWAELHQDALKLNWDKARAGEPLDPIPPLE